MTDKEQNIGYIVVRKKQDTHHERDLESAYSEEYASDIIRDKEHPNDWAIMAVYANIIISA